MARSDNELIEALSNAYARGRSDARNNVEVLPSQTSAEQLQQDLADMPPTRRGPGFRDAGGVSPIPSLARKTNAVQWTRDDIEQLRGRGEFLSRLAEFRRSLPGGKSTLFPAKEHK